jgi:hypothetical protein
MAPDREGGGGRTYVVGASKERLPIISERLRQDGFDVCGHCDRPREFCPPRDAALVLLITDMGCHATLQKARDYCRQNGVPCVGGVWRTWSTTRERLKTLAESRRESGRCPEACPLHACCGDSAPRKGAGARGRR